MTGSHALGVMRVCGHAHRCQFQRLVQRPSTFGSGRRGSQQPQKHVWRAQIIGLSGDGLGTSAIMAETGKSKTCVWRWQDRFMEEGVEGLLRDKTRPPGTPPTPAEKLAEIVRLTQ